MKRILFFSLISLISLSIYAISSNSSPSTSPSANTTPSFTVNWSSCSPFVNPHSFKITYVIKDMCSNNEPFPVVCSPAALEITDDNATSCVCEPPTFCESNNSEKCFSIFITIEHLDGNGDVICSNSTVTEQYSCEDFYTGNITINL